MMIIKTSLIFVIFSGFFVVLFATLLPNRKDDNFELLCHAKSATGNIPVYKFRSLKTGLHVIIANIEGPTVQGFFTIATETHDNDGLPHTLEHLVFLGSEDYPYKGVLDLLANRCLAEGTNAWTGTDHTAYTVETAGKDGFLNFLPIYLEHLLYPTLTDAGFTTEVYHINGKGLDAGVVYSEMQARENTGSERTLNELIQMLYPAPSGYRYETGGMMENLRNSINNEKIRRYHKTMYRPENLYVIITGQIQPKEIFQTMASIEDKIVSKGSREPFEKPWATPPPSFTESKELDIVYPSDNEDTGIVRVGWRGPSLVHNITEFQSMEVLLEYLTEVSVSPLPKVFVEVEDPMASYIYAYMLEYSVSSAIFIFGGVPVEKLDTIKPLLLETLTKIVNGTIQFDESAMRSTLNSLILKEESNLETSPHSTLSDYIILDVLYGENCQDMNKLIDKRAWYEHLLNQPSSYWIDLINKYLISAPYAFAKGIPSIAEANRLQEEERLRVEHRIETLGEKGLKQLEEKLAEAEMTNEIAPPEAMLESIPVPSTANINFHPHKAYTNIEKHSSGFIPKSDPLLFNLDDVPVKIQLNDVNSNFVQLLGILDTRSLSPEERMYLPLLMELLLESPIQNGSSIMSHDDVIKQLYEDTVKAENINGLYFRSSDFVYGPYFHNVMINLKTEMKKYEKGVEWMSNILFKVIFNAERVSIKANKLLNSIGDKKRDGSTIMTFMSNDVIFKKDTNINKGSVLRQEIFLNQIIKTIKSDPDTILQSIERIYRSITNLDNITILMATKLQKLSSLTNASKPWLSFVPDGAKSHNLTLNVISDSDEKISFHDNNSSEIGYIAGIKSLESSFLFQSTQAISNYSDPDLPALMTAISYFTQLEGPMWKQIRGKGLAYSYSVTIKSNSGTLSLRLFKAAQLIGAYKEALRILNSHLNETEEWNHLLFESARSSLVYEIVDRETDISDVVQESLYAYYRKVDHDYNKSFLRAIDAVTIDDVKRVYKKYFRSLLDPKTSKTVIVCPSTKATEFKDGLAKLGHNMEIINSLETSRFAEF